MVCRTQCPWGEDYQNRRLDKVSISESATISPAFASDGISAQGDPRNASRRQLYGLNRPKIGCLTSAADDHADETYCNQHTKHPEQQVKLGILRV